MFLSRLILNPKCNQVRREIAEPYQMHKTIMQAFPFQDSGGAGKVLFRVDINPKSGIPVLLVQSEKEPDWNSIFIKNEKYFEKYQKNINPAVKNIAPVFSRIKVGDVFRFRLSANPTKKIKDKNGENKDRSLRIGLYKEEDQLNWLRNQKAEQCGFKVLKLVTIPEGLKESQKGEAKARQFSVRFEGLLQISDSEKFIDAIKNGIGSAKSFGFGLLSIAPHESILL